MKKMIVMFAAVAMAIGAQAAEVRWTVLDSNAKGVYNLGSSGSETVFSYWNDFYCEHLTTFEKEDFDSWAAQLNWYQSQARFDSNGDERYILDVDEGETYLLLLVTYDNENFTPGGSFNAYFLHNTTTESPTFDLSEWDPIYSGNFGGEAIPEPTSGLMLLLGLAGLALKRKVA